jgi:5-formyltetrahydrofolate cyclo-ligase
MGGILVFAMLRKTGHPTFTRERRQEEMEKKALRTKLSAQRMAMNKENWEDSSREICMHILNFCMKREELAQVFLFYGINNEVPIQNLSRHLWGLFKLALPRVLSKGEMQFHVWERNSELEANSFDLKEPQASAKILNPDKNTIVLVPNLAMDREGYRLGYGGGFYDKFLVRHPEVISVGVNFSEFLVDEVPRDPWDRKVKWVCTEDKIVRANFVA